MLGLFALALVAGPLFVLVEARAAAPLLPLSLFRSGTFSTAMVYGTVANFTFYGMIFVLSLYFQQRARLQRHRHRLRLSAADGDLRGGQPRQRPHGRRASGCGPAWWAASWSTRCGFALLLLLGADSPYWLALPAFILMPAGMGTGIPAMIGAMLGSVERSRSGVASAVSNAARQAGGAIGVAVFGTLAGPDLVGGLHVAAALSAVLSALTAAAAWIVVPRRTGGP